MWDSLVSALGWLVTWATVIVGWVVVSDLQDYRELRKDRSSRLSDIRVELAAIEKEAVKFHMAAEFDRASAQGLVRRLGSFSRELSMLRLCEYLLSDYAVEFVEFKQACTGTNFDWNPKTFRCQEPGAVLLGEIMVTRDALDDLIVASLTRTLTSSKSVLASIGTVTGKIRKECNGLWTRIPRESAEDDSDDRNG